MHVRTQVREREGGEGEREREGRERERDLYSVICISVVCVAVKGRAIPSIILPRSLRMVQTDRKIPVACY